MCFNLISSMTAASKLENTKVYKLKYNSIFYICIPFDQCNNKEGGCNWLPKLVGFIFIPPDPEESVCRCNWAKCVSCKSVISSSGAQTIGK